MTRQELLDLIQSRAAAHQAKFPTFDLDGFMAWVRRRPSVWILEHAEEGVVGLNRHFHRSKKWRTWGDKADRGANTWPMND